MNVSLTAPAFPIPPFTERLRVALRALASLARDPGRLDQVLVFAQAVNIGALARNITRIEALPEGKALFAARPRIDRTRVDFDALERLPDGTLGREYVRFLNDNGITPDVFEELPDVGDARAAYVILRMRQTHDLWHVLTGYTPDVRGEILLQAFTFAQIGVPSAFLIAAFGSLRWTWGWRGQVAALRTAYARGRRASFLATFRWEDHWHVPVDDLRATLDCPLPA
ncbi:MAG: hypothetical protein KF819_33705 [Labilithrix sp.]|nr:hypothetical protein [Labilithrix sp.]